MFIHRKVVVLISSQFSFSSEVLLLNTVLVSFPSFENSIISFLSQSVNIISSGFMLSNCHFPYTGSSSESLLQETNEIMNRKRITNLKYILFIDLEFVLNLKVNFC